MDKRQVRAFEAFAAESGPELLRVAMLLTADLHTAEDIYQETLQRLAARWTRVDNPKAFCRRVMHNIVIDQARARARRPRELRFPDRGESSDPYSADQYGAAELRPVLLAALSSRPALFRRSQRGRRGQAARCLNRDSQERCLTRHRASARPSRAR
jgi:DNA-directed RNA polymerase specialized sigma24 family protein